MDEAEKMSKRTWNRTIATVTKIGFMDGASDGQNTAFQSSFNLGYHQGLNFGFELGLKKAISIQEHGFIAKKNFGDPRKINCQVCFDNSLLQQNVGNMYNIQQEKNTELGTLEY